MPGRRSREKEPRHGWLPFEIVAVHEGRQPASEPPHHAPSGAWTYLECAIGDESRVEFVVGTYNPPAEGAPFAWGEARMAVKEGSARALLLKWFATAFDTPVPTLPGNEPLSKGPMALHTAVLGTDQVRASREGGFKDSGGGWVATKWLLESGGQEAEVYFNYNIDLGWGDFLETDEGYRQALLAILARTLGG